ncbi:MAG: ABC transporter permease [Candidatus Acidiferrales bacterium]
MKLRNIGVVYRKELIDQLRDRRTVISMIVIPILIMPLLSIGLISVMVRLVKRAQQEGYTVMLLHAERATTLAEKIRATEGVRIVPPADDYVRQINDKKLRLAIEFPPGFEEQMTTGDGDLPVVKLYHFSGELRSQLALRTVQKAMQDYRQQVVEQHLQARNVPVTVLKPFEAKDENVAPPEKVSGAQLGGLIPYFIIILSLTGAMYPAMDLTAGEKERGTIETILASAVRRSELVLGKFLMVLTASVTTTLLALASFATTILFTAGATGGLPSGSGGSKELVFVISGKAVAVVFFMVLPLAVTFAAALLAIALLAKSYKEAQTYISPLMLIVILPAIFSLLPGVELNPKLALIPILNVSLVSKEILSGSYPWGMIALIFASSCAYAAAALFVAVRTFQNESVLFRT